MTPDQIDLEIQKLKQQLEQQKEAELPIEEQISTLQKQNWKSISKISNNLKIQTSFKVVCEKYMTESEFERMISCFKLCSRTSNWRLLQKMYTDKDVSVDNDLISFFASFYRRNVLNKKDIYLKTTEKEKYQHIIADFAQTEIFN
jgi:hypothetical protein